MRGAMLVDVDSIIVPRKRVLVGDVDALATAIRAEGMQTPIDVSNELVLIRGYLRLMAMKKLGRAQIPVNVHQEADIKAAIADADAKIRREDTTHLDRTLLLRKRRELTDALSPESTTIPAISEKLGVSESIIQKNLYVSRYLTEEAIAVIRGTPVENSLNILREIAMVKPAAQVRIAKQQISYLSTHKRIRGAMRVAIKEMPQEISPRLKGLRRPKRERKRVEDVLMLVSRAKQGLTDLVHEWESYRRTDMDFAIKRRESIEAHMTRAIVELRHIVEQCE